MADAGRILSPGRKARKVSSLFFKPLRALRLCESQSGLALGVQLYRYVFLAEARSTQRILMWFQEAPNKNPLRALRPGEISIHRRLGQAAGPAFVAAQRGFP
jgi:hypothetical protein